MIEERRGRFADTKSRTTIFLLAELALLVSAGRMLSAQETATVVLQPGQNIQAIVGRSPEGTRFRFEPGIYRQQTIYPKSRQSFIGQDGVILSGAMELRAWTKESEFWKSERLPHPLRFHGECAKMVETFASSGRISFSTIASTNALNSSRTWVRGDGTSRTVRPISPTIRPGNPSISALPNWPLAEMLKVSCSRT